MLVNDVAHGFVTYTRLTDFTALFFSLGVLRAAHLKSLLATVGEIYFRSKLDHARMALMCVRLLRALMDVEQTPAWLPLVAKILGESDPLASDLEVLLLCLHTAAFGREIHSAVSFRID